MLYNGQCEHNGTCESESKCTSKTYDECPKTLLGLHCWDLEQKTKSRECCACGLTDNYNYPVQGHRLQKEYPTSYPLYYSKEYPKKDCKEREITT